MRGASMDDMREGKSRAMLWHAIRHNIPFMIIGGQSEKAMSRFDEAVKRNHEILGTSNACYILSCGQSTEVALRGKESGDVHFYCGRCAGELLSTFNNLYERA